MRDLAGQAGHGPGAGAAAVSDYSALDRVLHRIALGSPVIAEMLHDIERAMFLKSAPVADSRPVFVTGLARAGTTILMREIHATGAFASLSYADMPFVLAPNLWGRIARQGAGARRERAHGDGIAVDHDSPEALDEVFWRITAGRDYIRPDGLWPHVPDAEALAAYADLMRLVCRRRGLPRYLSKNNNLVLRLPTLARALPGAVFLLVLRDPLAHAASLLAQHRRFLGADRFTRDYMTWLGHHEFGATHRPFRFAPAPPQGDPATIDYWLGLWLSVHRALEPMAAGAGNLVFVPHEALARDPAVWPAVAARIGIIAGPRAEIRDRPPAPAPTADPALAEAAAQVHARLAARGMAALGLAPPAAQEGRLTAR